MRSCLAFFGSSLQLAVVTIGKQLRAISYCKMCYMANDVIMEEHCILPMKCAFMMCFVCRPRNLGSSKCTLQIRRLAVSSDNSQSLGITYFPSVLLQHWRHRPSYSVLVDSRDRSELQTTYVAEENIETVTSTKVSHFILISARTERVVSYFSLSRSFILLLQITLKNLMVLNTFQGHGCERFILMTDPSSFGLHLPFVTSSLMSRPFQRCNSSKSSDLFYLCIHFAHHENSHITVMSVFPAFTL